MATLSAEELMVVQEQVAELIIKANRMGELDQLLEKIGLGSLIHPHREWDSYSCGKVVIIGDCRTNVDHIRMAARKEGIGDDRLELILGYEKSKMFDIRKLSYAPQYRLVLVGPVPHSTVGKGDSSSMIAELENHPSQYPKVIRLMTESGALKITDSTVKKALRQEIASGYLEADCLAS